MTVCRYPHHVSRIPIKPPDLCKEIDPQMKVFVRRIATSEDSKDEKDNAELSTRGPSGMNGAADGMWRRSNAHRQGEALFQ